MDNVFRQIVLVLLLMLHGILHSAIPDNPPKTRILLLESKQNRTVSSFSNHLRTSIHLNNENFDVKKVDIEQPDLVLDTPLVITIGKEALQYAVDSKYQGFVLASLIDVKEFERIVETSKNQSIKQISAIYHQAPAVRQILLFKELNPSAKRVGLLITPDEQKQIEAIKPFAYKLNLLLEYEVVSNSSDLSKDLLKLINRSDAIIATPNDTIYNRSTIKSILLTLYRHNKYLIGSNRNFIRAGSVATTYTSMQQLLDELVFEVNYFFANQQLRDTHYCQGFMVAINKDVARSLNLTIKDDQHYVDAIQANEITLGEKEYYE